MCRIKETNSKLTLEMLDNKNNWSEWLDFNEETIEKIPQTEGVYMMHASMKILFIGGSSNIKSSIKHNTNPCLLRATRIRYMQTSAYEKMTDDLIKDYQNRHEGKNPQCMEENKQ
jgi:hypothetical protein